MELLSSILGVFFVCVLSFGKADIQGDFGPINVYSQYGRLPHSDYYPSPCDHAASARARRTLQFAAQYIHSGFGKIPSLDPFTIAHLPKISHPNFGTILIKDVRAEGAALFKVNDVEVFLATKVIKFKISVPVQKLTFNFTLYTPNENIHWGGHKGSAELYLLNYSANGTLQLQDTGCHYANYKVKGLGVRTGVDEIDYKIPTTGHKFRRSDPRGAINDLIKSFLEDVVNKVAAKMDDLLKIYSILVNPILYPDFCYWY